MVLATPRAAFVRFRCDTRGNAVERWAIIAGVIAVGCVASAHLIDIAAKNDALPIIAFKRSNNDLAQIAKNLPRSGASSSSGAAGQVDMTATGSIASHAGAVLIDPCTGKLR